VKQAQIDPPLGWQFGFRKDIPTDISADDFLVSIEEWLVDNGYPQSLSDQLGGTMAKRCRISGPWPPNER
jgi:hypothetical protein